MSKSQKTAVQITRKGLIIWAVLFFFIAGWMFVLGILVGRGTAPVILNMDRLEKELIELKSALIKKENAQLENQSNRQNSTTAELGFYEALKQTKPARDFKVDPDHQIQKVPEVKPVPKKTETRQPDRTDPKKADKAITAARNPKAAKPDELPKISSSKKGDFTIQVAAFKSEVNADRMVRQLKDKGFPAYRIPTSSNGGTKNLYRVRVGVFEGRTSANTMLAKLQRQGIKGMVVAKP